jgi:hypothetical protein
MFPILAQTGAELNAVPSEFLKSFLLVAAFLISISLNTLALFRSRREVSGMVKTQEVQNFATQNELKQVERKFEEVTKQIIAAGEKRGREISGTIEERFNNFTQQLTALRAELRNEFSDVMMNTTQRVNSQGEKIARLEERTALKTRAH